MVCVNLDQSARPGHCCAVRGYSTQQIDARAKTELGGPVHLPGQHVEGPEGGIEAGRDARLARGVGQHGRHAADELVAEVVSCVEDALE